MNSMAMYIIACDKFEHYGELSGRTLDDMEAGCSYRS